MAPYWQLDSCYNQGDVVEFEGVEYKIIEPHTSQSDLTPSTSPALWERLRSGGRRQNREERSTRDRKPFQVPPASDYGQRQQQVKRIGVDEVLQRRPGSQPDRTEQQGRESKPPTQCPPDDGRKDSEQQARRVEVEVEVEKVPQRACHADREEECQRGRDFKPRCPPDDGKREQQAQRVEVEEVLQRPRQTDREEGWGKDFESRCPSDDGKREQQMQRVEVEEVLQRPLQTDREEGWGKDFKSRSPSDDGKKEQQVQRVEVEEVLQRPCHTDRQEGWGKDFKSRCPSDDEKREQQVQRVEVEEVLQRPRHTDRQEEWGKDFKPQCPPDYGQKEQQTLRIDSEYEQVAFQDPDLPETQAVVQHERGKGGKRWYDTDDKRKIGGGILTGVAALGAGYMAYNHFTEKRAARAWSANAWIADSQARTRQWRAGRYNAPVAWIWNEGRSIPRDAIGGGEKHGESIYICRVYHQGGIMIGKASSDFKKGAVIGYKKDEVHYDKYEILVGDPRIVRWITCSGQFSLGALHGARPVEGGREPDGSPIYIAQAPYRGAVYPGKACEVYGDGCFIPYDDTEKKIKEYAVLCYA